MKNRNYSRVNNFNKIINIKSELELGLDNKTKPVFTIAIPTYKRPHTFKETLKSALNQVGDINYEIIIVDNDDSEDLNETKKIVESFNNNFVRYYRNTKNLGMFGNWNRCIELASGEWLTILHDDDILSENYLYKMSMIIKNVPNAGLIANRPIVFSHSIEDKLPNCSHSLKDKLFNRKLVKNNIEDFYVGNPINVAGVLLNKKKAIDLGGFDDSKFPTTDYMFWFNMQLNYSTYIYRDELAYYRMLNNESFNPKTLAGFIGNDYYFKDFIVKNCKRLNLINNRYRKYAAINQKADILKDFKVNINLEDLDINNLYINIFDSLICKIYLKAYATVLNFRSLFSKRV